MVNGRALGGTGVQKDQIRIDEVFLNWGGLIERITQLEGLHYGPTVIR